MNDVDFNFLVGKPEQRGLHRFGASLNVGFNNKVKGLNAGADLVEQVVQICLGIGFELFFLLLGLALLDKFLCELLVCDGAEIITRRRHLRKAHYLDRGGRTRLADLLAFVVGHGPYSSDG